MSPLIYWSTMKRGAVFFLFLLFSLSVAGQSGKNSVAKKRSGKAADVIERFSALGADALPLQLLRRAKAIAVFGDLKMRDVLFTKGIKGKGLFINRLENGTWGVPTFLNFQAMKTELGFKYLQTEKIDAVFLFMKDDSYEVISGWKSGLAKVDAPKIRGKKIALGPVIGGIGADKIISEASVLYYTFQNKKLSGEEFPVNLWSNVLRIDHDDAMNKAIYKKKFRDVSSSTETASSVPDETTSFYQALVKISENDK